MNRSWNMKDTTTVKPIDKPEMNVTPQPKTKKKIRVKGLKIPDIVSPLLTKFTSYDECPVGESEVKQSGMAVIQGVIIGIVVGIVLLKLVK